MVSSPHCSWYIVDSVFHILSWNCLGGFITGDADHGCSPLPGVEPCECSCIFSYLLAYCVGAIVLVVSISSDVHHSSLLTLPYLSEWPLVYRGQFPCLSAHGMYIVGSAL